MNAAQKLSLHREALLLSRRVGDSFADAVQRLAAQRQLVPGPLAGTAARLFCVGAWDGLVWELSGAPEEEAERFVGRFFTDSRIDLEADCPSLCELLRGEKLPYLRVAVEVTWVRLDPGDPYLAGFRLAVATRFLAKRPELLSAVLGQPLYRMYAPDLVSAVI